MRRAAKPEPGEASEAPVQSELRTARYEYYAAILGLVGGLITLTMAVGEVWAERRDPGPTACEARVVHHVVVLSGEDFAGVAPEEGGVAPEAFDQLVAPELPRATPAAAVEQGPSRWMLGLTGAALAVVLWSVGRVFRGRPTPAGGPGATGS